MHCPSFVLEKVDDVLPVAAGIIGFSAHECCSLLAGRASQSFYSRGELLRSHPMFVAAFPEAAQLFPEPDVLDGAFFQSFFKMVPGEMREFLGGRKTTHIGDSLDPVFFQQSGEFILCSCGMADIPDFHLDLFLGRDELSVFPVFGAQYFSIRATISLTALSMPTMAERATIQKPILNSVISGIAATGRTFL